MSTMLERFRTLDPALIDSYRRTGKTSAIPAELQEYVDHVSSVPAIVHKTGAVMSRVVRELQVLFPMLPFGTARDRYYDAMNIFHVDDTISAEAWDNYYADKMEDLARLCIATDKYDTAKRCFEKAHEFRTKATERIDPDKIHMPIFIISNKIKASDLGYVKESLHEIASKAEKGEYIKLISTLPTTTTEKTRIAKDAGITDVNFEEVENE